MATVGPPKKSRRPLDSAERERKPRRRKRSWTTVLVTLVLLAPIVLWLAPVVLARSSALSGLIERAVPLNGDLAIGSASLGWFSPVVANDVEIRTSDGKPCARAASIATERTLLGLVWNSADIGRVRIQTPHIELVLRQDGSNVEDVLHDFLNAESESSSTARVEVVDGTLTIDDTVAGRHYQLQKINGSAASGTADAIELAVGAQLVYQSRTSPIELKANIRPGDKAQGSAAGSGIAKCRIDSLPVGILEPLLRRHVAGGRLDGFATANFDAAWDTAQGTRQINGELSAQSLYLAGEPLGTDQIRLAQLRIPCQVQSKGDEIDFQQVSLTCDVGTATLSGKAKLAGLAASKTGSSALGQSALRLAASLDVAKLAAMLPQTLRLREGTTIQSGKVEATLASQPREASLAWSGRVTASELSGTTGGRAVRSQQPLSLEFDAIQSADAFALNRAICNSSFVQFEASGTPSHLTAHGKFDLAQLAREAAQFVDFGSLELAGRGELRADWTRAADGKFRSTGQFDMRDFQMLSAGRRPWREGALSGSFQADGISQALQISSVTAARLDVSAGPERLLIELAGPTTRPAKVWPLNFSWEGDLARWLPRLEPWVDLDGWRVAGSGKARGRLNLSDATAEIDGGDFAARGLQVVGHGWFLNEPEWHTTASAALDYQGPRVRVQETRTTAGASSVQVNNAECSFGSEVASARGLANVQVDLAQIQRWLNDPQKPSARTVAGRLTGNAEVTRAGDLTTARFDGGVENLEVADTTRAAAPSSAAPSGAAAGVAAGASLNRWRERRLGFAANCNYDRKTDVVAIDRAELTADALNLFAQGKVTQASAQPEADLQGKIGYDWQKLAPLWQPWLGATASITGRDTRAFRLTGPLPTGALAAAAWQKLIAEASVNWTAAELYGLRIGAGELDGRLADGRAQFKPLDLTVSGGRVSLVPELRLAASPMELRLQKSALVRDVRLTPEICAESLKFVAPVLADATSIEGHFSIDLDGARFPLADLPGGDAGGKVLIHSAQLKPGPLAQQIVLLGKQIEAIVKKRPVAAVAEANSDPLLSLANQNIDFRLVNRRVYHRNVQFMAGSVPITTYGSVGLDESLDIKALVPIQTSWLGNDPVLAALKGQTIEVPIGGTLKSPKLDRKAVDGLASKLLENTARNLLFNELDKQLEKLLPTKP